MKLKPCPFCGSDKIMFIIEGYIKPWESPEMKLRYRCHCYECDADAPDIVMCKSMETATKEWNERKPIDDIVEQLEEKQKKYQRLCVECDGKEDEAMNIHYRNIIEIVKSGGRSEMRKKVAE